MVKRNISTQKLKSKILQTFPKRSICCRSCLICSSTCWESAAADNYGQSGLAMTPARLCKTLEFCHFHPILVWKEIRVIFIFDFSLIAVHVLKICRRNIFMPKIKLSWKLWLCHLLKMCKRNIFCQKPNYCGNYVSARW